MPTPIMAALEAIKESPALLQEMGQILRNLKAAKTPEAIKAARAFRERAVGQLVSKGLNSSDSRTQIDKVFRGYVDKVHGRGRGRPGGTSRDYDTIGVPDDFGNSKNVIQRKAGEARPTGVIFGSQKKAVERAQTSEPVGTASGGVFQGHTVTAKRGTSEGFKVEKGMPSKTRMEDAPDEREVHAVKITEGPHAGKWMLARFNADRRAYVPVTLQRGKGRYMEAFGTADEAELRASKYAKPDELPPSEGNDDRYQPRSKKSVDNPERIAFAKDATRRAISKDSRLSAAQRGPRAQERGAEEVEEALTGKNAPRVQTREVLESGRTTPVMSPFPDPRRTREGEPLPRDRQAPRAQTREVVEPITKEGQPRQVRTEQGKAVKSPFPESMNPDKARFLIKLLPFLIGGGALAAAGSSGDDE